MLSGKEKRHMRAEANQMKATVLIGREGVTDHVKRFIDEAFTNKILIKIRVLDTCEKDRKEIASILTLQNQYDAVAKLIKVQDRMFNTLLDIKS